MTKEIRTLLAAMSLSLALTACSTPTSPSQVDQGLTNPNGVSKSNPSGDFNNGTNLTNGTNPNNSGNITPPVNAGADFNDVEPTASASPNETPIVLPEPSAMPTIPPVTSSNSSPSVDSSLYTSAGIIELSTLGNRLVSSLSSLRPSNLTYSADDKAMLSELIVAARNQMLMTRAASSRLANGSVMALAEAETSFGMALKSKLEELAYAAGIDTSHLTSMASQFDTSNQAFDLYNPASYADNSVADKLFGQSTSGLDQVYIARSGVTGTQQLDEVLGFIETSASDPALKQLASSIHPLVRTQLRLAQSLNTAFSQ